MFNGVLTGNCNEIYLPTDKSHSFVCCLSSLNLLKYKQWKDWKGENNKSLVELAIYFLDAVMEDFIIKAKQIKGMSDAVRFAEKSRALGLGVLGWHSFLQSEMIPIESLQAKSWNKIIFKDIHTKALEATKQLAVEYGEPEWLVGTGRRNLTLEAIAPTVSNAKLSGGLSQGIEPYEANYYTDNDSKGSYAVKNPFLEKLLIQKNKNNQEIWNEINDNKGSVQTLDFLTDEEKSVFKTFREINQMELVKQASERQPYIEQGQSLNLAFFYDAPAKWIYDVHYEAWKAGLKGLYYLRSQSALSNSNISNLYTNCISCEG
jgi:ribonucleoside-diphosphate reductase alpha chain